jgi:hypothetical protein
MELLGDVGELEAHFSPLGDGVNLTQDRCMICTECTTGIEIFWPHLMDHLRGMGQMEACFGTFRDIVNLGTR